MGTRRTWVEVGISTSSSKRRAEQRERIPPFSKAYSLACRTIAAIGFRVETFVTLAAIQLAIRRLART